MFHDRNAAVVSAFAWLPTSLGIEQFNTRVSRHLVGTEPRSIGPHKWVWKSQGPVLRGMVYALGYDIRQTAYFHAKGQAGGEARRARGGRKQNRGGSRPS